MADYKLIRKHSFDCPLCDKTHDIEERERVTIEKIKGEDISYKERYYYCANSPEDENEFESGDMTNSNILSANNSYRTKHGLLTSDEIVSIRESYGLSQVDLARLMGWGEATISRYESKAIQDEAYDNMLCMIRDNPLQALEFLKKNSSGFTQRKAREIKMKIVANLASYGKEYLCRRSLESEYVYYDEPTDLNGYTMLNIDKIEASVSYIAERVVDLSKGKLMRILWYSDSLSYKKNGNTITGMIYKHHDKGILPIGHNTLMNLENINTQEEESINSDYILRIYPSSNADLSVLSDPDIKVLDIVIEKFRTSKAEDLIRYMSEDKPYKATKQGEIVPFSIAGEIKKLG